MIQRKLPVCRVSDLPPGKAVSFRYGVSNGIAYNDGRTIKAYLNRCTHMGGSVQLVRTQGSGCDGCVFKCSWHQAEFDPATGARLSGEAPEGTALKAIPLKIENSEIWAMLEIEDEFE